MKAHNLSLRLQAVRLHFDEHLPMKSISNHLNVSYGAVRSWVRAYRLGGEAGLAVRYRNCGRRCSYEPRIIAQALALKKQHEDWGAGFILVKLRELFPESALPGQRWLQKLFRRHGLQPQRTQLPPNPSGWAKGPLDRVQVDAKERLRTRDHKACCYLNFVDEFTGSELEAFVFPLWSH